MLINTSLFRRIEIQLLMNLTARALGHHARRTWMLPNDEALRTYAEFTRNILQDGTDEKTLLQMRHKAYKAGKMLRWVMHLTKQDDVERVTIALYKNIGIELEGHLPGKLCFGHCYFSQYYTPQICLAASALDEGIMRGLSGSGQLTFHQRITEGNHCCLATFK